MVTRIDFSPEEIELLKNNGYQRFRYQGNWSKYTYVPKYKYSIQEEIVKLQDETLNTAPVYNYNCSKYTVMEENGSVMPDIVKEFYDLTTLINYINNQQ